jgi:hypothetical protein
MDQRGFNDTSEDFISFKSRVLSFEGRDGPAISKNQLGTLVQREITRNVKLDMG